MDNDDLRFVYDDKQQNRSCVNRTDDESYSVIKFYLNNNRRAIGNM